MPGVRLSRSVILGIVLVAGGLAAGLASSYLLPRRGPDRAEPTPTRPEGGWAPVTPSGPHAPPRPPQEPPSEPPLPPPGTGDPGKRALLIGVTKYDHLGPSCYLEGPGNDVRLMRSTLVRCYGFRPENVVCLTEDEGKPELRPTRANIAREFQRLAEAARPKDQVVVLLAGHGDRQPESDPPDPVAPEPDGIDEMFLPADVRPWQGHPERVPNAITDKQLRDWLAAVTSKKAYVWAIFDCCHSATLGREAERVRQLPRGGREGVMVPDEEFARARGRAEKRAGRPGPKSTEQLLAPASDEYLVATYACREYETTPEGPQPASAPGARVHGLLTYTIVGVLEQSARSTFPVTYRELMHRVQASYLARPQGAPTPTVDGAGANRVVLGTEKPFRPDIALTRVRGEYVAGVGDLHGITPGSVLRVRSPAGGKEPPRVLGYARVERTRPLDSVVVPVEYEGTAKPPELPAVATCEVAAVDYSVGHLRVGVEGNRTGEVKRRVAAALGTLPKEEAGLFQLVGDAPHLVVRATPAGPELQVASGNRPPVPLPPLGTEPFAEALTRKLKAVHRARGLIAVGTSLEAERTRGGDGPNIKIEVLSHNGPGQGVVLERPPTGWVFRPGDRISFQVTNTSPSRRVEVSLLIVDPDYKIDLFYPARSQVNKALEPGARFTTGIGTISNRPPFGPEQMVAIVTAPTNPPVDFGLLAQPGVRERGYTAKSPVAQLLERSMYGTGVRSGLTALELGDQTARVLSWRTEPAPRK
ncbi:caspase family protein [Gemmata sp.]|uniref:caspase family protein n=1 Tax=Gemmata sp. TaxID=1914242 RepID=UPI003F724A66